MPTITVLYFANVAEKLKMRSEVRDVVSGCTPQCLKGTLAYDYKDVGEMFFFCRAAVNEEFVSDDQELKEGDVVALIPPVSGGSA
ncbi:MAG: molybdopterin converting factor subunit 1 [Planctomycetes bacterium]|nr:molybdopterin converting factor subunit 1 [Planctomycetota bacterium]